eukprot:11994401-Prorocentrum_lima.AAC.1
MEVGPPSLALVDFANAFGSVSRAWIIQVLRASGCHGKLMAYFVVRLSPLPCTVLWKGCQA